MPKRFVGQVVNLRPIVNRPVLWGSQSWLQPAFSRLSSSRDCRFLSQETLPKGSSPARVNASSAARRGVTLVEMLIVVSIIGLIVAVSFPAFSAGIDSVRMSSATGMVSSFLNSAVNRAERRQQAVELIVTPKENLMTMYTNEPGFERKLRMPDGVSIQAVLPAIDDEAPDSPRQLMLLPGATAPGIGILLANQHGSRRIVRLDPMTGFPRIESLDSDSKVAR
jgi:prepilin-type N-terminal cleavage/methylation domain-containing protein